MFICIIIACVKSKGFSDICNYYNILGSSNQPTKRSWLELVGVTTEVTEKKIKEEMPEAEVEVVPRNSFVTADFKLHRVRLFIDNSHKVMKTPAIG